MTFKAIVKDIVGRKAEKFVYDAFKENGFNVFFCGVEGTTFEHDKEMNTFMFESKIDIHFNDRRYAVTVIVGGTADDCTGICTSVIWTADKKRVLWMNSESARKQLEIEKIEI